MIAGAARPLALVAGVVGTLLVATAAAAQPVTANEPAFSVERFTPAPGAGGFFVAESAEVLPRYAWSLEVWGTLSSRPIVFNDLFDDSEVSVPVRTRLGYDLLAAIGLGSRYQVGAALPIVAAQDGQRLQGIDLDEESLRPITVGDLRLHGKVRAAGTPGQLGLGLAASLIVTVPTGDEQHFAGEKGTVVEWRLIGSYDHRRFRVALDLGPRLRTERVILLSPARAHDNELIVLAAAEAIVPGLPRDSLSVIGEFGAVRGDSAEGDPGSRGPSPREARAGLRWRTPSGWSAAGGLGFGTAPGEIGSPAWRVFVGARYDVAPHGDLDRDGVPDALDRCPDLPEDRDSFEDLDGCPDLDNDGDGVPDASDECPNEPEDLDGVQDLDGCPEEGAAPRPRIRFDGW